MVEGHDDAAGRDIALDRLVSLSKSVDSLTLPGLPGKDSPLEKTTAEPDRRVATLEPMGKPATALVTTADRIAMAKELQLQLRRVGCYRGRIDGIWGNGSRRAMRSFNRRINAGLPVSEPDNILLTLVGGYDNRACGRPCRNNRRPDATGRCVSDTAIASANNSAHRIRTAQRLPRKWRRKRSALGRSAARRRARAARNRRVAPWRRRWAQQVFAVR